MQQISLAGSSTPDTSSGSTQEFLRSMSRWRIGVDSGGTFTDVCMFDEQDGRVEVWKVPSTPDDPSRGIAGGVEEGLCRVAPDAVGPPAASVSYFGHGTTVATNA